MRCPMIRNSVGKILKRDSGIVLSDQFEQRRSNMMHVLNGFHIKDVHGLGPPFDTRETLSPFALPSGDPDHIDRGEGDLKVTQKERVLCASID